MKNDFLEDNYKEMLKAESQKWGEHLKVESSNEWHAWIDHPLIAEHYRQRSLLDGLHWENWVSKKLGGPAERSLDLGCGSASRSISAYKNGASKYTEGLDASPDRIAEAERLRQEIGIPGSFQTGDVNVLELPANAYDLIFSCHSFHHFVELEHIMAQVHRALTPRGLFILEEFVGPTQFQWTDQQIDIVRSLMSLVPERMRVLRWGATKTWEGRPTPAEVMAVSPFESIRSQEIFPLFQRYFNMTELRRLGGTIQHLFYNGIVHNFHPADPEAVRCIQAVWQVEDSLIDLELLPSDFMLLVGQRKDVHLAL